MGAFGSLVDAGGAIDGVSDVVDYLRTAGDRVPDGVDFVLNTLSFSCLVRGRLAAAHGSALVQVPADAGERGLVTDRLV